MRHHIKLLAVATILIPVGLLAQTEQAFSQSPEQEPEVSAPATPDEPSFAPDRILVKAKENASTGAVEAVNRKNNARTQKKIPRTQVNIVKLPKELPVEEAVERYEASPDVEYAEPDYKIYPTQSSPSPNDPSYSKLWGMNNTGQSGGTADADIDAPGAWNVTSGDAETLVAVIDTGIDIEHPDLKDNVWVNPDEVAGDGVDNDRNGYVDDVNGWDFRNNDNSVFDSAADDDHGTHKAGIIAAEGNNSVGVAGVDWQAKIVPLKFIGPETGYMSDAAEALNYAVAEGIQISNNSYGCAGCLSQTLRYAIERADAAGHLFVTSAGNNAANNDADPHYPSDYASPNIVAVASTDDKDALSNFSNYGAASVDLAAPGSNILSTLPENNYGYRSGTSSAAPHVAGVAALTKIQFPNLDDSGIKNRILSSVDQKAGLEGKTVTGGRLNAAAAMGARLDETTPTITSVTPVDGTTGMARNTNVTATLSEEMDPETVVTDQTALTSTNVKLYERVKKKIKRHGKVRWVWRWVPVSAEVSYDAATKAVTLKPYGTSETLLDPYRSHRVVIGTGVKDEAGNALAQNHSWTFTTGSS